MKRGILLAVLIVTVIIGIYSVKEWMPVMAIAGNSMEPKLKQGDAVFIGKIEASEVKAGDVIVFSVHPLIQEKYRYPAIIAHRVIGLTQFQNGLAFKTKGDNTAEDPFVVPASDVRGEVNASVPYLGYILLFLQSRQGIIFAIIAITLLGIELYFNEIKQTRRRLQRGIFAPVMEQNQEIAKNQQETARMTVETLQQFSEAVAEYAKHLASHTSAIQGLSEASHELKKGAAEQNRVLAALLDNMKDAMPKDAKSIDNIAHTPSAKEAPPVMKKCQTAGKRKSTEPNYHKALEKGLIDYTSNHPVKPGQTTGKTRN